MIYKKLNFIIPVVIASGLMLSGCNSGPKPTLVHIPSLKTISKAEIGQNMFESIYAVYKHENEVKFLDNIDKSKYTYDSDRYTFYMKKIDNQCVMIRENGRTHLYDKNCDGVFTHGNNDLFSDGKLDKEVRYTTVPAKPSSILPSSWKYDVLYQGKIENKLNITFREYYYSPTVRNFMIRDSFTQNIQYELNENGKAMIGFKGLRIKVLKATNLDIEYQVIKDYDKI
ncbi:hypothetical protein GJV85_04330 [Sulfurimonas aquatica]|uniref:Lipoprotein n=1 Tax=Sulfurimonas aquatica TaxID=2672570 RepID=A0A975GCJ1_9BACT|nr:hypothetical protein [Sulfurimonas aquatica]QSZ41363.1 hypothetical protein GJV85_04330 [Sulfurimonas aquatica]